MAHLSVPNPRRHWCQDGTPRIPISHNEREAGLLLSQNGVRDRSRCLTVEADKRGAVRRHVMLPGWVESTVVVCEAVTT